MNILLLELVDSLHADSNAKNKLHLNIIETKFFVTVN